MKNSIKVLMTAAMIAGFSSPAALASDAVGVASSVQGDILIQRDGEFFAASEGAMIMAGDSVFAKAGSSAVLSKDSCSAVVQSDVSYKIGEAADCEGVLMAQASNTPAASNLPSPIGLNAAPGTGAAIALGLLAATAAAIIITDDVDDKQDLPVDPISP